MKEVRTASEAIAFLLELERINRNSRKRVVLDCPPAIAKEILVSHVNNIHLGRRNFHYLMSSLVFDDHWDDNIAEYGAINVTGFRLVDHKTPYAKRFFREWKSLDQKKYSGVTGEENIGAIGALAYDAVNVMSAAFNDVLQEKPNLFRHNVRRGDSFGKRARGLQGVRPLGRGEADAVGARGDHRGCVEECRYGGAQRENQVRAMKPGANMSFSR